MICKEVGTNSDKDRSVGVETAEKLCILSDIVKSKQLENSNVYTVLLKGNVANARNFFAIYECVSSVMSAF